MGRAGDAILLANAMHVRHRASRAAVVVLAAYALLGVYVGLSAFWQTPGSLGLATDYGAMVRSVTLGGPAARAGVRAHDNVDLLAAPFGARRYLSGSGTTVPIGTIVELPIQRAGLRHNYHLTAIAAPLSAADQTALLFVCLASLVSIGVGATLIVLRPSPATWGFGLYCLLSPPSAMYVLPLPDARWALAVTIFYDIVQNLGIAGLLLFALEFPQRARVAWRDRLRRALPAIFIVLAAMTVYPDVANQILGRAAQFENLTLQAAFGAAFLLAMTILADTYRRVEPDERERMRWVLIGFACGLLATYAGAVLIFSSIVATPPVWLSLTLTALSVLLPVAVAHAVVRHRVLDVRFAIGRALVFAVLTTILAGIFALLDYIFGTVLEDFRLSRVIAAGLSLALAFAFKWLEERATSTVEALFFRRRHAAEARLSRAAHGLPHARSEAVVETIIVGEVAEALDLTSAALFSRDETGRFARAASTGWSSVDCMSLDDEDLLVLALREEIHFIDLTEFAWRRSDVPRGEHALALAVPIRLHDTLAGFILYGSHPDGSNIEPSEIALLERLAYAAGLALDQLEARQLRTENDRQRAVIGDLTARLDELRHHLPP